MNTRLCGGTAGSSTEEVFCRLLCMYSRLTHRRLWNRFYLVPVVSLYVIGLRRSHCHPNSRSSLFTSLLPFTASLRLDILQILWTFYYLIVSYRVRNSRTARLRGLSDCFADFRQSGDIKGVRFNTLCCQR